MAIYARVSNLKKVINNGGMGHNNGGMGHNNGGMGHNNGGIVQQNLQITSQSQGNITTYSYLTIEFHRGKPQYVEAILNKKSCSGPKIITA
jgi:hypothetical protein